MIEDETNGARDEHREKGERQRRKPQVSKKAHLNSVLLRTYIASHTSSSHSTFGLCLDSLEGGSNIVSSGSSRHRTENKRERRSESKIEGDPAAEYRMHHLKCVGRKLRFGDDTISEIK